MRRVLTAVAAGIGLVVLASCASGRATKGASTPAGATTAPGQAAPVPALATKTVDAGAVTVKIDPVRIDTGGAEFTVSFDTHSVALDLDVARNATLTVAGTPWGGATWSGDGPGGHHRTGTLRFAAAGAAQGSAVLSIGGLPGPVTATWALGG